MSNILLDSSLKTPTILQKYNCKIINCGDILQVYLYEKNCLKKCNDSLNKTINDLKYDLFCSGGSSHPQKTNQVKNEIEYRNIIRSKFQCQRIALSNMSSWETFITLTYSDNLQDISLSRKHFSYFIDKIRRIKKDLMYLCVTEFQKRGAIHYHLLTNINTNDKLMYLQNGTKFYHIKYWNYGFTSVENVSNNSNKIIGYISKYMTKDIDNRLFFKKRFLHSNNLKIPIENFIDLENKRDLRLLNNYLKNFGVNYSSEYMSPFKDKIYFLELKKEKS